MKKYAALLLSLSLVVTQVGCSTVFGRQQDEQTVSFDSNVDDVEVLCSGRRIETPGIIPLKQSKSHSCIATRDGYKKKTFRIRSGTSWGGFVHSTALNTAAWGWWTLGIGTAIGWLVDWPSGAMRNLKEDTFYIEMKEKKAENKAMVALEKTVQATVSAVEMPIDAVKNTASGVLDATVHSGAKQLGVDDEDAPVVEEVERAKSEVKVV